MNKNSLLKTVAQNVYSKQYENYFSDSSYAQKRKIPAKLLADQLRIF